jgi:hypothetical protein
MQRSREASESIQELCGQARQQDEKLPARSGLASHDDLNNHRRSMSRDLFFPPLNGFRAARAKKEAFD